MTVAHDFLLLAYDSNTGRPRVGSPQLTTALAGAALVELTLEGVLGPTAADERDAREERLVSTGKQPDDLRLADIVAAVDGSSPKEAIDRICGLRSWRGHALDLRPALLRDLTDAGEVTEVRRKVLGLFPTTVWKPRPDGEKARIERRVRDAVAGDTEPDDRTCALISLLHAVDLLPELLPDADRAAVQRRGKSISDSEWSGPAVRKTVGEIQAVTLAVLVATTVATTAGS